MKPSFDDLDAAATAAGEALALLECGGIAEGYAAGDRALKAAPIRLLLCRPVSPGKFLLLFAGAPASVVPALRAALDGLGSIALDTLLLPNVEPAVIAALAGQLPAARGEAAGIVEGELVATLLAAADVALKSAAVVLLQLRAAVGLGGKAFFVVSGDLSQVESALAAATRFAEAQHHPVATALLSRPHGDLEHWLAGARG